MHITQERELRNWLYGSDGYGRERVLRKTQLSNRYELSRWASDRRLV